METLTSYFKAVKQKLSRGNVDAEIAFLVTKKEFSFKIHSELKHLSNYEEKINQDFVSSGERKQKITF